MQRGSMRGAIVVRSQQARELVAENALIQPLYEGRECRTAGLAPQREFEHVDSPSARLTAADQILANTELGGQRFLPQSSTGSQVFQLFQEERVLVCV